MNFDKMLLRDLRIVCKNNPVLYIGHTFYKTRKDLIKFMKSKNGVAITNSTLLNIILTGIGLLEMIKNHNTVKSLLDKFPTYSEKGNIYEKLWDLVIKFGCFDKYPNNSNDHYKGNINTCKLVKVTNLESYIKNSNVFSKNDGGSSDITMRETINTKKWIFGSCKFYEDDNKKSIKDYDIQDIIAVTKVNSYFYKDDIQINLFVHDKTKVNKLIKNSKETNKYLRSNIGDIYDLNDLEKYYQVLIKELLDIDYDFSKINAKFCNNKQLLQLRFHQRLIVEKTIKEIHNDNKQFLWGWKCRAGKTFGIGGLLVEYFKFYKKCNALIITPAPTETLPQFTNDLFYKFRDFNNFNIIEIKTGNELLNFKMNANDNIIIVSKQLLNNYINDNKCKNILDLNLDLIVFDENHYGGTTNKSRDIINSYSNKNTIKLYLTATFQKPLNKWVIPTECQYFWDIEDEQYCKTRNVQELILKHGPKVKEIINDVNLNDFLDPYDKMPNMHIITTMMDNERYNSIKEKIMDTKYGFSPEVLFSLNKSGKEFNFSKEVQMFLRFISGSNKEVDFPLGDKSIFSRIKNISLKDDSRTTLDNKNFTTQLWFLPFGKEMNIDKVSECLKKNMLNDTILNQFAIMIINSKKPYKLKDLKFEISQCEIKAKANNKIGLILLAGNQCSLGITLPLVDIVMLLNNTLSSDKILQMMYRCMSESEDGSKKNGYIVDFNISRVLYTMMDYEITNKDLTIKEKLIYIITNNLINIDSDLFQTKENKTKLIEKLMDAWKSDPINNLKILLKKIEYNIIDLETSDQKRLNKCFASLGQDKINANIKIEFDTDVNQELQTGRIVEKSPSNGTDTDDDDDTDDENEQSTNVNISFTKDILPFVIPLSCILTINDDKTDFIEMLKAIKNDHNLFDLFNEQSFIWWNKSNVIELIKRIVEKYVKKNSDIYNIAIQFKMSLKSLIDNPKELLELIDTCLKPKDVEKRTFGEVFTPMSLINEMLDKLDEYHTETTGRTIFKEKDFKWFDPANGMGNFPIAVYMRLMNGLKDEIKNEKKRKAHILEKMLYMSELNKKNVFITRQIFDINNEYKLNLHNGDTLNLNTEKEWGIDKFHVILGNPPYNKGGIRSHTGKQLGEKNETIWTRFIESGFKWLRPDGYLMFINPLSWLKKTHSLHNVLLEKHIIWLKLWDNSQSKGAINADIPLSLYILRNRINVTRDTTEIISVLKRRKLKSISNEYLNKDYSIPLAYHNIFNKLVNFIELYNLKLDHNTKTIKSIGTKEKIPLTYELEDNLAIDTYTIKDGIMVKKATEMHPDAHKRKLIIANKASFNGIFIDDGKLSLTGNHKFYILGNNLELVMKLLSFNLTDMIGHYTKYGQDFLDNEAFTYIPDIRKLKINDINELDFYKLIGLTDEEITIINPLL
jgi:hypothetical protein